MVKKRWRNEIPARHARDSIAAQRVPRVKAFIGKRRLMDPDRIARLTEMQRKCLRLVYAHLSSKEIAPRLGVEPGTVDQYIKAAMRTLGVSDRRAAARMLAEHEGAAAQPLVYQPPEIADAGQPTTLGASTGGRREAAFGEAMREDQASFEVFPMDSQDPLPLPLPIRGRRPEDLNPARRLGWIALLILLLALSFGIFIAGLEALSRLGRTLG
jgi:DNA-binding CsgD family transcriptional regulator